MKRIHGLKTDDVFRLRQCLEELALYLGCGKSSGIGLWMLRKRLSRTLERVPEKSPGRALLEGLLECMEDVKTCRSRAGRAAKMILEVQSFYKTEWIRFERGRPGRVKKDLTRLLTGG